METSSSTETPLSDRNSLTLIQLLKLHFAWIFLKNALQLLLLPSLLSCPCSSRINRKLKMWVITLPGSGLAESHLNSLQNKAKAFLSGQWCYRIGYLPTYNNQFNNRTICKSEWTHSKGEDIYGQNYDRLHLMWKGLGTPKGWKMTVNNGNLRSNTEQQQVNPTSPGNPLESGLQGHL